MVMFAPALATVWMLMTVTVAVMTAALHQRTIAVVTSASIIADIAFIMTIIAASVDRVSVAIIHNSTVTSRTRTIMTWFHHHK